MDTFPDVAPMATIAMKMSTFVSVAQLELSHFIRGTVFGKLQVSSTGEFGQWRHSVLNPSFCCPLGSS
jgi:hypothetical protein